MPGLHERLDGAAFVHGSVPLRRLRREETGTQAVFSRRGRENAVSVAWGNGESADVTENGRRIAGYLALYGSPSASLAHLMCDSHPPTDVAFRFVEPDLSYGEMTYGDLRQESERFAAALAALDVHAGDRVATLMGKTREYVIASMAIWRLGAVQVPLFTAFAPPAIELRLTASRTRVVICDPDQLSKINAIPDRSFHIITCTGDSTNAAPLVPDEFDFSSLIAAHDPGFPAAALGGDAPFIHIFTSGTTGTPKGVVVPTRALAAFRTYLDVSLDVRPGDVYWNAADPGWAYGLFYAVVAPMCHGVPSLLLRAGFSPDLTVDVLSRFGVTNFAAAPTVYRALRASELPPPDGLKLRCASAAGEPLTPEVNQWAPGWLGVEVFDHYGQTEAGMLVCNHHHPDLRQPLRSGSMGQDMPGWRSAILKPSAEEPAAPGTVGRLALDLNASPLAWFTGYDGDPQRTGEKISQDGRWYLTGDTAAKDEDGYVYFSARDDDLIIMAGYRIGPFELESVLAAHPAVAECAVVAVPDEVRGEVIEAFVRLRAGEEASESLAQTLKQLVRENYAAHAYPRRVHFVDELPKTPSGKIQRFVLRERRRVELG
jgi:acetyl-CoA synthetase